METKTFTVDNILVLMTWGSDKKVYVKYFRDNQEIKYWLELDSFQRSAINSYCSSYCEVNNLTLWSY